MSSLKDALFRTVLVFISHAQCYDGAASMCGVRGETSTQICREESRALFVHFYGHVLNLAGGDTIKNNRILRNTLDNTFEISKLP